MSNPAFLRTVELVKGETHSNCFRLKMGPNRKVQVAEVVREQRAASPDHFQSGANHPPWNSVVNSAGCKEAGGRCRGLRGKRRGTAGEPLRPIQHPLQALPPQYNSGCQKASAAWGADTAPVSGKVMGDTLQPAPGQCRRET